MPATQTKPRQLFYEHVTERIAGRVIRSTIAEATPAQIKREQQRHKRGKCQHTIVYDEPSYLYDIRACGVCGAGLGLI